MKGSDVATKLPKVAELTHPYRVKDGGKFRLKDFDPADTQNLKLKYRAGDLLEGSVARMSELQQMLYAQDRWALLLLFQSMDAGGKDSVIRHVMSGVSPEGCQVYSFKAPSPEELSHDFLWRTSKDVPERGRIGIFSRSYYEEVLVVRIHPELLERERLPPELNTKNLWSERLEDIGAFEKYLGRNGFVVRKFFLHVSKEEQKKRLMRRIERADKHWKFSEEDIRDREHWDGYMQAYEDAIRRTATQSAPWYIVPADHKWFTRLVVVSAIIHALESLPLAYPDVGESQRKEMESARKQLSRE